MREARWHVPARCVFVAVVGVAAGLGLAAAAAAAPPPGGGADAPAEAVELPEQLSQEQVRALVARLSDDQVRALLLRELDKEAQSRAGGSSADRAGFIDRVHAAVRRSRDELAATFAAWDRLGRVPGRLWSQVTAGGAISSSRIILGLILVLAAGWAAERLFRRAVVPVRSRESPPEDEEGFSGRLGVAALHALLDAVGLAIFGLTAVIAMSAVLSDDDAPVPLFVAVIAVVLAVRLASMLVAAVVAPRNATRRLVPLDGAAARAMHAYLTLLSAVLVAHYAANDLLDTYGVDYAASELVRFLLSLVVVAAFVFVILRSRSGFAAVILAGGGETAPGEEGLRQSIAAYWHVLAIAYVLGVWMLAVAVSTAAGQKVFVPAIGSLVLLAALPLVDAALRALVTKLIGGSSRSNDEAGAHVQTESRLTLSGAGGAGDDAAAVERYRAVALRNLRIVVGLLALVVFFKLWGVDLGAAAELLVGERFAAALFDIGITAFLVYAVWGVVKAAVAYHVGPQEQEEEGAPEGEVGGAGASRLQTLLPLFRKFILITLVIMGVMIALSSLGVNIGPLIAGAGVVGLAIGFGAQTLVRDIVSGVFFLLDDAFRMGEYVEIDQIRGRVEAISIRSLRLRHHNGPLHTIPFGEIKHLTNYSRDWAIMKFELRLPFETDINKVRKIIKGIGQEMMADEELGPLLLGPLKSQGVNRMDDSALIVRCKFTAVPGQQFYVRREAFTRIQKAFEENGIHFAPRRVIVEAATPALARAAAAAGALDTEADKPAQETAAQADDRG